MYERLLSIKVLCTTPPPLSPSTLFSFVFDTFETSTPVQHTTGLHNAWITMSFDGALEIGIIIDNDDRSHLEFS